MARDKIEDPVFGPLAANDEDSWATYYRGEADLTPKHRVVIDFALEKDVSANDGLAVARSAFERVRCDERFYRLVFAKAFLENLGDADDFFGEPGWTIDRVADLLTLHRVDVSSGSGRVRLIYACKEGLGQEDLAVTFDEDDEVEEIEDPYR
jgi:hypothetical protein